MANRGALTNVDRILYPLPITSTLESLASNAKRAEYVIRTVKVRGVGSFVDFSNENARFDSSHCVVYGLNGSGKSQLCSLLGHVGRLGTQESAGRGEAEDARDRLSDYCSARVSKENQAGEVDLEVDQFKIHLSASERVIHAHGVPPRIHVFSEEYVVANVGSTVNLPGREIRIGETNRLRDDLQKELRRIRGSKEKVSTKIDELVESTRTESGYKGQVRTDRIISRDNYLSARNPCSAYPDARSQLSKLATPPNPIQLPYGRETPSLPLSRTELDAIGTILESAYVEPAIHQEVYQRFLQSNRQFYEQGVALFESVGTLCPFCLTPKNPDDAAITELTQYIRSEYTNARKSLEAARESLTQSKSATAQFVDESNSENQSIRQVVEDLGLDIEVPDIFFNAEVIDQARKTIEAKLSDMTQIMSSEDTQPFKPVQEEHEHIGEQYEEKRRVVATINKTIESATARKRKLGEQIVENSMPCSLEAIFAS